MHPYLFVVHEHVSTKMMKEDLFICLHSPNFIIVNHNNIAQTQIEMYEMAEISLNSSLVITASTVLA